MSNQEKPIIESIKTIPKQPRGSSSFQVIIEGKNLSNAQPVMRYAGEGLWGEYPSLIRIREKTESRLIASFYAPGMGMAYIKLTTPDKMESNIVELPIEEKTPEEKLIEYQRGMENQSRTRKYAENLLNKLSPTKKGEKPAEPGKGDIRAETVNIVNVTGSAEIGQIQQAGTKANQEATTGKDRYEEPREVGWWRKNLNKIIIGVITGLILAFIKSYVF